MFFGTGLEPGYPAYETCASSWNPGIPCTKLVPAALPQRPQPLDDSDLSEALETDCMTRRLKALGRLGTSVITYKSMRLNISEGDTAARTLDLAFGS